MKWWRFLFYVCLFLLIVTNIGWFYIALDNAVTNSYTDVVLNEYQNDAQTLKNMLNSFKTKNELLEFVNKHDIPHSSVQKGDRFIISFSSFDIFFNSNGDLSNEYKR